MNLTNDRIEDLSKRVHTLEVTIDHLLSKDDGEISWVDEVSVTCDEIEEVICRLNAINATLSSGDLVKSSFELGKLCGYFETLLESEMNDE